MCVTDLFIEREEQSNIPNNANQGQNLWRRHSVTNWIWWRDKNREMLFICYTKTNFIIHNSLYARFAPCNSHDSSGADCRSEYAGAFNNLTRQCLFSTCPQLKWICLNFVSVLFMSSFDTPCFPRLPSEKVCHLKRRRLYPRINQHSFGVRIRTHLTLKCLEEKRNPSSLLSFFPPFYALQRHTKDKKPSLHPFEREYTPCYFLSRHFSRNFIAPPTPPLDTPAWLRRAAGRLWQLRTWHKTLGTTATDRSSIILPLCAACPTPITSSAREPSTSAWLTRRPREKKGVTLA